MIADRRGLLDLVVRIPAPSARRDDLHGQRDGLHRPGQGDESRARQRVDLHGVRARGAAKIKRGVVAPRLDWTARIPVKSEGERRARKARKAQENPLSDAARWVIAADTREGFAAARPRGVAVPAHPRILLAQGHPVALFQDPPRRLLDLHSHARAALRRQFRVRLGDERAVGRCAVFRVLPRRADSVELLRRAR